MRYVVIPENIQLENMLTGEPLNEYMTWDQFVRIFFTEQGLLKSRDFMSMLDARQKLLDGKPGDVVDLPNDDWAALNAAARQPTVFAPGAVYQMAPFLKAILNAQESDPRKKAS